MLRTLVIALALGAPVAAAEEFPRSAVGMPVVGDDGTIIGEVRAVERNSHGEIVAVEIDGLEPDDAPASGDLVAENDSDQSWIPASARTDSDRGGGRTRTATR